MIYDDSLYSEKKIIDYILNEFKYPIVNDFSTIDLSGIKTEEQLLETLSKGLGFYRFPMEWNWLDEYLTYSDSPRIITIKGMENVRTNFEGCYHFIIDAFDRLTRQKKNFDISYE